MSDEGPCSDVPRRKHFPLRSSNQLVLIIVLESEKPIVHLNETPPSPSPNEHEKVTLNPSELFSVAPNAKSNNNELNDNIDKHWILSAELHKALLSAVKANQYTDLYVLKFFSELARILSCQQTEKERACDMRRCTTFSVLIN